MSTKNYITILTGVAIVLGIVIAIKAIKAPSAETVTNFEECAAAGYPIRETYPEQCAADGKVFTRDISDDDGIIDDTDTTPPPSILPYNSGIRGVVMIGPTCPVVQFPPTGECDDKPYETTIDIYNSAGARMAVATSESDGTFEVSLPPGTYTLKPNMPQGRMPSAGEQTVTVLATGYVEVTVQYDSGIR
ncbi:MAG: hypothetical protein A2408_00295 [Candidatus Yonathbacteria bacterium RIFOXYC1_FULL_52_10]|uniref:Carboxypeptidase regulatory-like domain-containing protein n=1 Tax=Candidatus Yonathbacteria bacterium RIFOXYD1_FULL_52_36 TaxID=1802730 RepID=A0A1G2SMD0_9BACT|nr:MAG: hypothetical protein A2408_00295 [Candidatus Yonathbacteria bacterium RIFOXYC1_FULL_52_10]OHA86253.1 MAG: hypothetical protein A2591_01665 [Candidatus Yonathbacteria bacterium RIFOXYD1_FULL_52_36]